MDEIVITLLCPWCGEYTETEREDHPPNGTQYKDFCIMCGKEFVYEY